jgi:4-amino-4-deoxy-L-arabinose transferase-like glycosyltransferase
MAPADSSIAVASNRREWVLLMAVVLIYVLARILLLPNSPEFTHAFSHDSGYLADVAANLLSGKGYVDDALWLVFLQPASVPMPYHNANPLFPTLTAAVTIVTGNVFQAGFLLGILASAILFVALFALVRPYVGRPAAAMGLAFAVVLFPPVLHESFLYLTDALCTALLVASIAVLQRARSAKGDLAGGVLLGLAWLTRAATILAVPAFIVYLLLRYPLAVALRKLAVVTVAALIVASPWLIHTKAVWGSYLRSDSEFSIVQDLAADKSHGHSVMRYWHSTEPPPSLSAFVRAAPFGFVKHTVAGAANVARRTLSWWFLRSLPTFVLLTIGALFWSLERRRLLSPEAVALAVFASATIVVLAIRGDSFEERYVDTLTVVFVLVAALGCWRVWQIASIPLQRGLVAAALIVMWGVIIPLKIRATYADVYSRDASLVAYRAAAAEVNRDFARGTPVVVGTTPYFYSIETAAVSLNFPDAPDDYLLKYMDRYGAQYVFLTGDEIDYWRPTWRSAASLPAGLRLAGRVGDAFVLGKTAR